MYGENTGKTFNKCTHSEKDSIRIRLSVMFAAMVSLGLFSGYVYGFFVQGYQWVVVFPEIHVNCSLYVAKF